LLTHLNLEKVHTLESALAQLHEQCMQSHSTLSAISTVAPVQAHLAQFLHRGHTASSTVPRLQSLLDALRHACFELQSLGVLLPSSTAFANSGPAEARRDWTWIFQLQQALKKRGVPAAQSEMILRRATQEENYTRLRMEMYEQELQYHRNVQKMQVSSLMTLLQRTEDVIAKFHTQNNGQSCTAC
jgi:hypothetical protein